MDHLLALSDYTIEDSLPYIRSHLGFMPDKATGKVLDIGCGMSAKYVMFLRKIGKDAEGIDPLVELDAEFLMRQSAVSIPRPDNYYGLVCSHRSGLQFSTKDSLHYLASQYGDNAGQKLFQQLQDENIQILSEAIRVLKPGSALVVYPYPSLLEDAIKAFVCQGKVTAPEHERISLLDIPKPLVRPGDTDYLARMVLTKV